MLSRLPAHVESELLVDETTGDDAAVLRIDGNRALVQTLDFFTPIVDDPSLFGAIAAANSISDIYAMGGEPILGLAIAAFPSETLPLSILEEILKGGADKAAEAGFPVAGGHTIIDEVPKYGLAVTGFVPLDAIVRNSTGRAGDRLYLTKPVGNGILISAHRGTERSFSRLRHRGRPSIEEATRWMASLNRDASRAMVTAGVRAATDVTGYGLAGHLLGMCRASGIGARLSMGRLPVLEGAREWLARGFIPAGSKRNREAYRPAIRSSLPDEEILLACDAQTSGGLLIAVSPEREGALLEAMRESGTEIWGIGELTGEAGVIALER